MMTYAVKHPTRLEAERFDALSDDIAMVASDSEGNRVVIIASFDRWNEALRPFYGPRPSPAENARAMYLRGEVDLDVFECELDREARRFVPALDEKR